MSTLRKTSNAPDPAAVAQIEMRILNETVAANRNASGLVALIMALAAIALLANMHNLRDVPVFTLAALGLGVALLTAMPILIFLRPKEDAYPLVRFWVVLLGLMIAGQIVNYLFGAERSLILELGWPPLLVTCIPLFLLVARAFLVKSHARTIQWSFLGLLALACLSHWALNIGQARYTYGMGLLLVTVCLIGPLVVVLVDLQLRVQGTAYRALQAELLHLQRQHDAEHQLALVDDLTGLLNRQGIEESLDLALAANELTGMASIEVANAAQIQQFCEPSDYEKMLREIAVVLKHHSGYQLMAGRCSQAQFLLWGKIAETEEQWSLRAQEVAMAVEEAFSDGHLLPELRTAAQVVAQGTGCGLALEQMGIS